MSASQPVNKFVTQILQKNPGALLFLSIGNPVPEYSGTKHNAGHAALEFCAAKYGGTDPVFKNQHVVLSRLVDNPRILIGRSLTYMNNSGNAVRALMQRSKQLDGQLIIVHDDIDLDLATVKFKLPSVKQAGHNGLASILKTHPDPFMRLQIGIGSPHERTAGVVAKYVLSKFSNRDKLLLENQGFNTASEIFDRIVGATQKWRVYPDTPLPFGHL